MATLKYLPQYFSTTLNVGGGIDDTQTTGIVLQSVSGVTITKPGQICVSYSDPLDTGVAEWIDYTSINGSNELVGVTRGREGYAAKTHLQNATVAFVMSASHHNDVVDLLNGTETGIKVKTALYDANGNEVIKTPATTSAVNEVTVTNSATGNAVQVSATGDDTNIDLKLVPKGTGAILDKNAEALSPNYSMARQAIINGNFDVWQRGTSYNSGYTDSAQSFLADRWADRANDDGGTRPTLTRSRQALTTGELTNSFYFSRLNTNGAGTSLGVNSYHRYEQQIEHGTRLLCGNGKTVTLSFWARSDIANKRICPTIFQNYGSGGSPSTLEVLTGTVITLTSTLTKYTQTFTTNTLTGKTFGTANDDSLSLNFYTSWGTTHGNTYVQASVTAETYVGAGNIDIAQVQLCAGDVALPFQPKSFEEEKRACMRYCYWLGGDDANQLFGSGWNTNTTRGVCVIHLPTEMRIIPTPTYTGTIAIRHAGTITNCTAIGTYAGSKNTMAIYADVSSGLTAGQGSTLAANSDANCRLKLEAEL